MTGRKEPAQLQARHTPRNTSYFTSPCSQLASTPGATFSGCLLPQQLQAQIIHRARKVLEFCPITPVHRKPPWPGYKQTVRLFTKLLVAHPLVGVCLPPDTLPAESLKLAEYMVCSFEDTVQVHMQEWCGKQSWRSSRALKETQCYATRSHHGVTHQST